MAILITFEEQIFDVLTPQCPETNIQKVVWQKFENQKSEMYKIFIFSRRTSWNVTFFLETLFKGSKSSSKMVEIEKLLFFEPVEHSILICSTHEIIIVFIGLFRWVETYPN